MLARIASLFAALFLPVAAAHAQLSPPDLFVDVDATGPVHDGSSWCSAYLTLDEALAVVTSGQTIRVAGGLYTPDPTGLLDPRAATYTLVDGSTIVGAYAGCGAPNPWARDFANHTTILRGDPLQNDQSGGTQADNSYHVLTADGLSSPTVIDGLYMDAANADSPGVPDGNVGGGLIARKSSGLRVVDCIFQDCKATTGPDAIVGRGGAVYLRKSKVVFVDTLFRESIAGESGGGVYMEASSAVFDVCTFAGDVSGITGGGLTVDAKSRAALAGNDFFACSSNSFPTAGAGGDVAVLGGRALLVDCAMSGDAGLDGGSIAAKGGTVDAVNCTFVFDSAGRYGGAVYASGSAVRLVNGRFTGCSADRGGAVWSNGSKLTVSNCTIADNSANAGAAGIELVGVGGGASVGNTILWGNDVGGLTGEAQQISAVGTTTLLLNHSDVEGLTGALGGVGNIGLDPLFVNPTGFDWRLSAGSPCIDAGSASLIAPDFGDLDGDFDTSEATPFDLDLGPRVVGAAVDMGAYERP